MSHPYDNLSPSLILDAVESIGFEPDGGMLSLNSYENRVLQIGMTDAPPLVAKFYRPDRWTDEAIFEEHEFSLMLAENEIPVIAPMQNNGKSLFEFQDFRFALFKRSGGRWPELDNIENLKWLGRFLGRIHQAGSDRKFSHRPDTNVQTLALKPSDWLIQSGFIPQDFQSRYENLSEELSNKISFTFNQLEPHRIRLHGDCHPGNILWTDDGPHFVDMDDCRNGPAIQDLWMLLSGSQDEMRLQLEHILEGYEMFRFFDRSEIELIEPLRTLRLINYTAWLAKRWDDPAFPKAFPWFNSHSYWADHIETLEQQLRILD